MFSRHWKVNKNLFCEIGEDGGLIRLWNIAPVTDEEIEDDDGVPKVLSQMDDHTGGLEFLVVWEWIFPYLLIIQTDKTIFHGIIFSLVLHISILS